MCLIVDANCAVETLSAQPSAAFAPVLAAILKNSGSLVMGGSKLRGEYKALGSVFRFFAALERAGKAQIVPDETVDAIEHQLRESGVLRSDDPHIIALAQVSGARLLCSRDQNLHKDFLSAALISKPRGNVYQTAEHDKLLKKCCS